MAGLAVDALDDAFKAKIEDIFRVYYLGAMANESSAHEKFMAGLRLAKQMHERAVADLAEAGF